MVRRLTPYQMKKSAAAWAAQVNNNRHLETEVQEADAHKLTQMLYTAILSHLQDGIRAIERQDDLSKNKWLNKAQAGINELRVTLRHDIDPEFSGNLDSLYEYCGRQLGKAKAGRDTEPLLEVINLLQPIKEAWENVADEARKFREDLAQYQKEQRAKAQQGNPES